MVAKMQFMRATDSFLFCFVFCFFLFFCFCFVVVVVVVVVFSFCFVFEILPVQPRDLILVLHVFVCLYQIGSSTNLEQIHRVYQREVNSSKNDSDNKTCEAFGQLSCIIK